MTERIHPPVEAIDQANDLVNEKEDEHMFYLFNWLAQAKHKAESCKCFQCQQEYKRVDRMIADEVYRLTPVPKEYPGYQEHDS